MPCLPLFRLLTPRKLPPEHLNASNSAPGEAEVDATQVDRIAGALEDRGLAAPALVALHIARPLSWVGGQMLWALQPFLGGAGNRSGVRQSLLVEIAGLLEDERKVNALANRLEAAARRK